MSLAVPLCVVVKNGRTTEDITNMVRGLKYRHAIPGGFANIQASIDASLASRPDIVDYYTSMFVYDGRNGTTLAEGSIEDPERSAGDSGETWGLTAIGPSAIASDQTVPLIYADRRTDDNVWSRVDLTGNMAKGSVNVGDDNTNDNSPVVRLQWDAGQTVNVGDRVSIQYLPIRQTGQWVARISADHVEGVFSSGLKVETIGRVGPVFAGSDTTLEADSWNTTLASILQRYGNEHSSKYAAVELRLRWPGAGTTTSGTNYWTALSNVVIVGSRYNADGTEQSSGYTTTTVDARDVVRDLLGRLLSKYDGANASIATSTYAIPDLLYPDGAHSAQIFDDLMKLEPNTFWAVWESNAAGKYRFEWSIWPTDVDYEVSTVDGFSSPGSAVDMYDKVTVRYKGAKAAIRTAVRTQSVPQLTAAGRSRSAFIDLGDEAGGANNADQIGDNFLAAHATPPNKGQLAIKRPIVSRTSGRMLSPWELRPGRLIRVLDVEPSLDALNSSTRDGVTIFRIVAVDYDTDTNTATLELDSYARSAARVLADVQNNPALNRRRR